MDKGDKGLEPINYPLHNGITIRGFSKKTKKGKVKGAIVAENVEGTVLKEVKEKQFGSYKDFKKNVKEFSEGYQKE